MNDKTLLVTKLLRGITISLSIILAIACVVTFFARLEIASALMISSVLNGCLYVCSRRKPSQLQYQIIILIAQIFTVFFKGGLESLI